MSGAGEELKSYYRFQARIYDATRWSFLFGRSGILDEVARRRKPRRILEVGCGTGRNLLELAKRIRFAQIVGMDLSEDMLEKARKKVEPFGGRVKLVSGAYGQVPLESDPFDVVLFSYCLTMVNPGYRELMKLAIEDLAPDGVIAIVDFHDTPWGFFRSWMGVNHVRFEGQILEALKDLPVRLEFCEVRRAYFGVWRYLMCLGVKNTMNSSV
jgi:S-adenosylmethionine-diacylgycerolhomoserine-N-methlytransferase